MLNQKEDCHGVVVLFFVLSEKKHNFALGKVSVKKLFWKVPLAVTGVLVGLLLLLLIAAASVLFIPSLRSAAIDKAIAIAQEKTGLDLGIGDFSLDVGESPMSIYRAYKGKEDLPVALKIDSLFVGHRGKDTLIYVHKLDLNATVLTAESHQHASISSDPSVISALPIVVEQLQLDNTTFHSDSLIEAVGVDVILGNLSASSPELNIAKGQYPLHGLQLSDAFIGIDLRDTPPDTTAIDTTAMPMVFDVPDGNLSNVRFKLTPVGLDINVRSLQPDVLADVGANKYIVRRIDLGGGKLAIGDFTLPIDTLYGDASVDLNSQLISSSGLHARSDEIGAKADLSATALNLETMRVDVVGDAEFRGSKANLRGYYDIDDEAYAMHVGVERVDISPFMKDSTHVVLAGEIDAKGKGFDIKSHAMQTKVNLRFTDAIYDNIDVSGLRLNASLANKTVEGTLHLPVNMTGDSLQVSAQTEHQFRVTDFMKIERIGVDYHAQMTEVKAHVAGKDFVAQRLDVDFGTDSITSLNLATEGVNLDVKSPMHLMSLIDKLSAVTEHLPDFNNLLADMSPLDTLRDFIPDLSADINLRHGSPVQFLIDSTGLDINEVSLLLHSDSLQTNVTLDASIPDIQHPEDSTALRLPAANAALRVSMSDGKALASFKADSKLTDGAMTVHGLRTDAELWLNMERTGSELSGAGGLKLDSIMFGDMDLGNRHMDLKISPSDMYAHSLKTDIKLDDVPLSLVDSIIKMADLELNGIVRAKASVDGLPSQIDISAEVLPLNVSAKYKPYEVGLSLGENPIVMNHNKLDFNGLPIYGADSTYLSLNGGLDLNSMRLDVTLAADSFAPAKLVKDGPIPVYGELATDIHGNVTGSLDSIIANVDVKILPTTDITYPIDKKNLAQVKPSGTVNVHYDMAEDTLLLGGRVNVDDGFIRYSPKIYPIMPFHVDSGSHVLFNGSIGQTELAVSASQKVKADVESKGEETRRVEFVTGVRVNGVVDSIGINSLEFFLEAPKDETITRELASIDEDTREGLAATLLATGMYVGESNVAAQREGYALSSIINSRINAAMANSKLGSLVDIDISSARTKHASGQTNDMNISISKSFLKDRLRITLGSKITDSPEVNKASGLLNNLSAEYKLTKEGNVSLHVFSQRDYNNIFEGELYKSGIGVRAIKEWKRQNFFRGDSITRTYNLTADAGVAYRSNNSLGPDLTLTSSMKNLLGKGETFTIKGNGAYYWALRNRHPGDPKKTDTYKFGVSTSLVFPYLHWVGHDNPDGDTRYLLGYQYENIAGGYGVHKIYGSFTYFIKQSKHITHAFTPFSLSVVLMKAEADSLISKIADYPQLIKIIAGNEFIPSIGYNFIYDDYRDRRTVNTMLNLGVKESGSITNAIYCAFGYKWNDLNKPLGSTTFNQFVKLTAELHNRFNITDRICIATRLFAGVNMPFGNSADAPLSEAFYTGGPNSMRAASPYAYGPGNFHSEKYNQNFFHAGDVKLEANFEFRFPIVWKLCGAVFVDAGNVWNWKNTKDRLDENTYAEMVKKMELSSDLLDGIINNPELPKQIALGTGAGFRLDLDGLVIRLDIGVAIHSPFQTYKYTKDWKPDYTKPINNYFNIPSVLDAIRINFGIGYPF